MIDLQCAPFLCFNNTRFYDPALGRFREASQAQRVDTSPDTIIPSTQGAQGWDRYAYVNNNPVRYSDPTGHICVNDDGDGDVAMAGNCGGGANSNYNGGLQGPAWNGNSGSNSAGDGDDEGDNWWNDGTEDDWWNVPDPANCDDFWNSQACLDNFSIKAQDVATMFSITGAVVTTISTIGGCLAGIAAAGVGFLAGCAGGYASGAAFHLSITNYGETIFSGASLITTIRSDYISGDNFTPPLDFGSWKIGEDTETAFFTAVSGTLIVEPFFDAGIDIYSSGYNHGVFCGSSIILNC